MRMLFISPYDDMTAYPVRLLSSIVKQSGHSPEIVFLPSILEEIQGGTLEHCFKDIIARCRCADLIGFSFLSIHYKGVSRIARAIREKVQVPIIFGGKHISARPEDAFELADFIAVGESDSSLPAFLDAMAAGRDMASVPGIWQVTGNALVKTPLPPLEPDLDRLPFPDYSPDDHFLWDGETLRQMDDQLLEKYWPVNFQGLKKYETMGSRGCPFSCTYCYSYKTLYQGQKYLRFRSPESIISEIQAIRRNVPYIEKIVLSDDNFFAQSIGTLERFAAQYKKDVGLPFYCLAHPSAVTEARMDILVDAGLRTFQIGVQTGSAKTQALYKRRLDSEIIIRAAEIVHKYTDRVIPRYDFITDNPFEDEEDVLETLRMIARFPKPYLLNTFSLVFLPGTELFNKAQANNIPPNWDIYFEEKQKTYLNLLFRVSTLPMPRWMFRLLLLRPVVSVMSMKLPFALLSWGKRLYKRKKLGIYAEEKKT